LIQRKGVRAALLEDERKSLRRCLRCDRCWFTDRCHRICPECSKINERLAARAMCVRYGVAIPEGANIEQRGDGDGLHEFESAARVCPPGGGA